MRFPLPKFLNKYVIDEDEADLSITTLQGGSSSTGANGKQLLMFIAPMWTITLLWNILPGPLISMGLHPISIVIIAVFSILMSIVGPIFSYMLIQTSKIHFLGGRDKHKMIFGWNSKDFDITDTASSRDPENISLGGNLTTESFLKHVGIKLHIIKANEIQFSNEKESEIDLGESV